MIDLLEIRSYLYTTTKTISSVLGMDVLICDDKLNMVGDSDMLSPSDANCEKLSAESILTRSTINSTTIVLKDVKSENPGCATCNRKENCDVISIIVHPIICDKKTIGAIGIYAKSEEQQDRLIKNEASYISFIQNMCQMITGKLDDEASRIHLLTTSKKMEEVIEAINFPFININEKNEILHYNKRFEDLFFDNNSNAVKNRDGKIPIEGKENESLMEFIKNATSPKESTFSITTKKGTEDYDVTFSPVIIEGIYRGGLIYFKKTKEFLDKINYWFYKEDNGGFENIIGKSKEIIKVKEEAETFAKSSSTIFIQGESGTGKEVFARAIHSNSKVSQGPFITVNCAAIPDNLMESEFFGYEEGSFTGAMKGGRIGKFELANNGTLFLDEIGELPIHLQSKLLRALQERKIQKVGGTRDIEVDIRIITATNRDLEAMTKNGEFREDLYYRLNVIPLTIPPLRERVVDIPVLVNFFVQMYSQMLEKDISKVSKEAMEELVKNPWAGNVRELQNTVEYAVNRCKKEIITIEDFGGKVKSGNSEKTIKEPVPLSVLESVAIEEALLFYGNTLEGKEKVARALGISRATLYRKINQDK